ncbi:hypothetical protein Tco_1216452 [Tanacetum coccineum]
MLRKDSLKYNTSYPNDNVCSSLALEERRLDHLLNEIKQLKVKEGYRIRKGIRTEEIMCKRLSMKGLFGCGEAVVLEEKGEEFGLDSNDEDVVPKVEDVPLVDGVLEGAFGGEVDEDFAMGEDVWMRKLGVDAIDILGTKGKEEDANEE